MSQWTTLADTVNTKGTEINSIIDAMGQSMSTMASKAASASTSTASAIDRMIVLMSEDINTGVAMVEKLEKALNKLPKEKIVKVRVEYSGPDAFDFGSPNFKFYYAFQRLVDLVEGNPVPISVTETGATSAAVADVSTAAATSAQVAAQIAATPTAVQAPQIMRSATINMGGQTINNGMDAAALQIMIRQAVAQAL